jgi:hypothetical protein
VPGVAESIFIRAPAAPVAENVPIVCVVLAVNLTVLVTPPEVIVKVE